ncbi:MAG: hypothetical protein AAFQ13_03235 [Pseudomonadota bacterium]
MMTNLDRDTKSSLRGLYSGLNTPIDASIVVVTPKALAVDDRWLIVLDPRAIEPVDTVIPISVANLARDTDEDEDAEVWA